MTEGSIWYKVGSQRSAKRAGEGVGGGSGGAGEPRCQNCNSGTHNTDSCWGQCSFCDRFGHKTSQCRKNPDNKVPDTGAVKKAGAGGEGGKLTKGEKHRLNKQRKKKAEEAAKEAEIDAVKKAAIETFNETDTEEYFPKKADVHSARQTGL